MRNAQPRAIGILAGGGNLPVEIAESLTERGAHVKVIAFEGEALAALNVLKPTYVRWGQVDRIIKTLKSEGCNTLVIVGSVTRPDLGALKPDLGFFKALPTIFQLVRAGGDDAVLRGVISFFEKRGISIVSPAEIVPELVISHGPYCKTQVPNQSLNDIALGFAAIRQMAPFDVGQSVVVSNAHLETIEGVDGTDAMLNRTSTRRRNNKSKNDSKGAYGVLIKRPKPGQELRIDLPVIGARTVMQCAQANMYGIAVEAGKVLAVERDELRAFADAHNLFIEGFKEEALPAIQIEESSKASADKLEPFQRRTIGHVKISRQSGKDAIKGGQLLHAMDVFNQTFMTIVSRGHVLSIDNGDERLDAIERYSNLRQWGVRRWSRRSGVVILNAGRDADEATLQAAAKSGLACVAVRLTKFSASVSPEMIERANQLGLAIAEVFPGEGA